MRAAVASCHRRRRGKCLGVYVVAPPMRSSSALSLLRCSAIGVCGFLRGYFDLLHLWKRGHPESPGVADGCRPIIVAIMRILVAVDAL